jgi:type VI secretion system secreted protein VgrG
MTWTRTATVSTTLGDDVLLFYAMTAREELGRPFLYEVDLLSEDMTLDLSALLGQPMSIGLETTDDAYREFNGVVTDVALTGELGRYVRYRATVRPWLWLLTQRKNSRIFQDQSVPEVLKALFGELGFSDFVAHLSGTYEKREYLVQYRETDFNFVSRSMEEEGIYYFFKHEGGKHTLVLCDSYSNHEATPGYEQVPYYPKHEGERRERDYVDGWLSGKRIRPGAYTAFDFNYLEPREPKHGELSMPLQHAEAEHPVFEYPGRFQQNQHGGTLARIRLEELQADHEIVKGTGNARGLSAGTLFSLTGFPREDQNKEYLLVQVSYVIRVTGYESGEDPNEPPDYRVSFSAVDAHRPFRPPRITPKPTVEGPQTAFVVGQSGQEIWTDEYGRVKLRFHWDRDETPDEKASCWVRVAQVWAGNGFGGMHLPRCGQEVIVDFLEGDPDRPIVTGRVYNAVNTVPYKLPDNATQSGLKSRSSKDGTTENFNEIRFEDKKGSEELHIQAEKDMTTLVKHDQSTTVQQSRSASVGGSDSVSVTGNRSLSVHGTLSVSVDGSGGGPPHSSHTVTGQHMLHASDNIEIDAPNHIKLVCGKSSILLEPSQITIAIDGGASIVLDPHVLAKSKQGTKIVLDANALVDASTGSSLVLDGTVHAKAKMAAELQLDSNALLKANADVTLDGMNVTAKGKVQATVQVGGSSVQCSPAGTQVGGPMVNVNGTAMVSIGGPMIKIG